MKRLLVLAIVLMSAGGAFAWRGHHGWHGGFHHHHYHHGGFWGRGGCHFWPGFVGGVVGGAIASSYWSRPYYTAPVVVAQPAPVVVPQPVVVQQPAPVVVQQPVVQPVVQQPVVQAQRVWVEGCYIDQPQPNGTSVRVWNPGHYEMR